MKKNLLFTLTLLLSVAFTSKAQISTLPYTQDFSDSFIARGTNVEFLPNIVGSIVAKTDRIFRDSLVHNSAPAALGVIPTGSFDGEIIINLDLTAYSAVTLSFKAKSIKNSTGTRPSNLSISTSIDGGSTWSTAESKGDFPNEDQASFTDVTYNLPSESYNVSTVKVRIFVTTGTGGTGTRAKLVIDDIKIEVSSTPITSVTMTPANLNFTQVIGTPSASETMTLTGSNLSDNVTLSTTSPFEISTSEAGTYGTSLVVNQTSGTIAPTNIYVRMNSNFNVSGNYIQSLTAESDGIPYSQVSLSGAATLVSTITAPEAFILSNGNYSMTEWDSLSVAGTYPSNMVFWTHATTDPDATVTFLEDYGCIYDATSRSRINGKGKDGFSFVNTGSAPYMTVCNGEGAADGGEITYGRVGAAVLALNASNRVNVKVAWTARTLALGASGKVNGWKMQYKIGNNDLNGGWVDLVSYSSEAVDSAKYVTDLPTEVNSEPVVLVRWIYVLVTTASGSRQQLGLDDIMVTSDVPSSIETNLTDNYSVYPNPITDGIIKLNKYADLQLFDIAGKLIETAKNTNNMEVQNLNKGVYILKINDSINKKIVIK